jgi:hypothetical protein
MFDLTLCAWKITHPPRTRLALNAQEGAVDLEHEVVPLVVPERQQHPIPSLGELSQDDRLCAGPDVDRMTAVWGRRRQAHRCAERTAQSDDHHPLAATILKQFHGRLMACPLQQIVQRCAGL